MSEKNSKNTKTAMSEKEHHKRQLKKIRLITAAITVFLILILLIICGAAITAYNNAMNSGESLRRETAAIGTHHEVDGCMMNYYFNDTYNTFLESYGSYVYYLGLDPSLPLREQRFSDGESWFDFIMRITRTSVTNIIALNEAADEAGITLTDAERSALRRRVDGMDTGLYGNGVNHDDIYNAKLLEALAYKFRAIKEADMKPDTEYINSFFDENSHDYLCVDYYKFPLYYPKEGTDTSDAAEKSTDIKIFTEAEIAELAKELAAIRDADEFITRVRELLLLEDPSLSDSELDSYIDSIKMTAVPYTEDDALSEWAFSKKAGDTVIVADTENTTYTVYFLVTEPYVDTTPTVNIRHILLYDSTFASHEDTIKKANELLSLYESGERSADSFGLLALEHSEEDSSYYSGGLYEHVVRGKTVESIDQWCFGDTRSPGDTAIIETDYGCHLVRFEEYSYPVWQANISNTVTAERTEAYMTEITGLYPTLFDENVIDMIPD